MKAKIIILSLIFLVIGKVNAQSLDADSKLLFDAVNNYRKSKGLKDIPYSPALTKVAQTHVKDLADNHPDQGECNMHSWSENGTWTACCYTPDHHRAQCMWDKPRELTKYRGNGYEVAASGVIDIEGAMGLWKDSPSHNDVILNLDIWDVPWLAMGAAIYNGYAVVWFGNQRDMTETK